MSQFKYATVTIQWTDSAGVFHPATVCFSNADNPVAHTRAQMAFEVGRPVDGVLLYYVGGFRTHVEAELYCIKHGLRVV